MEQNEVTFLESNKLPPTPDSIIPPGDRRTGDRRESEERRGGGNRERDKYLAARNIIFVYSIYR